jgi:hypothetical protein
MSFGSMACISQKLSRSVPGPQETCRVGIVDPSKGAEPRDILIDRTPRARMARDNKRFD